MTQPTQPPANQPAPPPTPDFAAMPVDELSKVAESFCSPADLLAARFFQIREALLRRQGSYLKKPMTEAAINSTAASLSSSGFVYEGISRQMQISAQQHGDTNHTLDQMMRALMTLALSIRDGFVTAGLLTPAPKPAPPDPAPANAPPQRTPPAVANDDKISIAPPPNEETPPVRVKLLPSDGGEVNVTPPPGDPNA